MFPLHSSFGIRHSNFNLLKTRHTHRPIRNPSITKHPTTNPVRNTVATENDNPIPVASATYAARQIGHFGISARIVPGMIHPFDSDRFVTGVSWAS